MNKITEILIGTLEACSNDKYFDSSIDGNHVNEICEKLMKHNFKKLSSTSTCTVATKEEFLIRDGYKVEIITSNCFGVFTQVTGFQTK